MPPSTETFGIPELLVTILENALPQDLLLWQRVNKTWQVAILQSPRIQEKLYFRMKPCKDTYEQMPFIWNALFVNILLGRKFKDLKGPGLLIPRNAFGGKASYSTASWKQMFVTSPAITEMSVDYHNPRASVPKPMRWIVCESGITIGQIAENLTQNFALGTESTEPAVIWNYKFLDFVY